MNKYKVLIIRLSAAIGSITAVLYFLFSLAMLSFDMHDWEEGARHLWLFLVIFFSLILSIIISVGATLPND